MYKIFTLYKMLILYIKFDIPVIYIMFEVFAILKNITIFTTLTILAIYIIYVVFIKSNIPIVDRIRIIALGYQYKELIKTVIPLISAISVLLLGIGMGEGWRKDVSWAIGISLTVITLLVNLSIEWIYYQMDSRDANNYSRFIECLLKYNKKVARNEYKNENGNKNENAYTHIISDIWEPVLGKDCRVSYYVMDVPEDNEPAGDLSVDKIISSGAILKAKAYNNWSGRGHMELTIEDKEQLKSIFTSMWSRKDVYYDDIRLSKYSKDMKGLNIDPDNKKYVSFIRIPIGNYKGGDMAMGVLIADSDKSCYFRKGGFNYRFAQLVAQVIESLYFDRKDYSDETVGASVGALLPEGEDFPDVKDAPDGDSDRRNMPDIFKCFRKR